MGNHAGLTPLHYAVWADNLEAIKVLLSYDANINTQAKFYDLVHTTVNAGDTALHLAAGKGSMDTIKVLLKGFVSIMCQYQCNHVPHLVSFVATAPHSHPFPPPPPPPQCAQLATETTCTSLSMHAPPHAHLSCQQQFMPSMFCCCRRLKQIVRCCLRRLCLLLVIVTLVPCSMTLADCHTT